MGAPEIASASGLKSGVGGQEAGGEEACETVLVKYPYFIPQRAFLVRSALKDVRRGLGTALGSFKHAVTAGLCQVTNSGAE